MIRFLKKSKGGQMMPRIINQCKFYSKNFFLKRFSKKRNKRPLPVGIKSEREKGRVVLPPFLTGKEETRCN